MNEQILFHIWAFNHTLGELCNFGDGPDNPFLLLNFRNRLRLILRPILFNDTVFDCLHQFFIFKYSLNSPETSQTKNQFWKNLTQLKYSVYIFSVLVEILDHSLAETLHQAGLKVDEESYLKCLYLTMIKKSLLYTHCWVLLIFISKSSIFTLCQTLLNKLNKKLLILF